MEVILRATEAFHPWLKFPKVLLPSLGLLIYFGSYYFTGIFLFYIHIGITVLGAIYWFLVGNFWDLYLVKNLERHGMPKLVVTKGTYKGGYLNEDGSNKTYLVSNGENFLLPYNHPAHAEAMEKAKGQLKVEYDRALILYMYHTLVEHLEFRYKGVMMMKDASPEKWEKVISPMIRKTLPYYLEDVGDSNPDETFQYLEKGINLNKTSKNLVLAIQTFLSLFLYFCFLYVALISFTSLLILIIYGVGEFITWFRFG